MQDEVKEIKSTIKNIDKRLVDVESRTKLIEMTLENEIKPNIKAIAEGHSELNRKFDQTLKMNNEKEWMQLRINTIENDIKKIKYRLAQ